MNISYLTHSFFDVGSRLDQHRVNVSLSHCSNGTYDMPTAPPTALRIERRMTISKGMSCCSYNGGGGGGGRQVLTAAQRTQTRSIQSQTNIIVEVSMYMYNIHDDVCRLTAIYSRRICRIYYVKITPVATL